VQRERRVIAKETPNQQKGHNVKGVETAQTQVVCHLRVFFFGSLFIF
jgi:hypothetical protein